VSAAQAWAGRATVLVSGAPGAGKTTLAGPLARALGFALLSKDHIKETLHDALDGPAGDRAWSRYVGGASMELLWALASQCPHVVLEANFRPHSELERSRVRRVDGPLVEVHCQCPPEVCARRYAQRAARSHPVHAITRLSAQLLEEFDAPMGLCPVIGVDTTGPVDVAAVAAQVRQALAAYTGP
jgi:predicted kinase